jgi:hypothetical protein
MNPESPGNARNSFNLSMQTLSSIGTSPRQAKAIRLVVTEMLAMCSGYGSLYPGNTCSRCISAVESFVSMLVASFMTGIAFVKFARPHPNIVLSDVCCTHRLWFS